MTKPLRLKEGAYYRRRDGNVVGPLRKSDSLGRPWMANGRRYLQCGRIWSIDIKSDFDLMSEFSPGSLRAPKPPRKVAKRKTVVRWGMLVRWEDGEIGTLFAHSRKDMIHNRECIGDGPVCGDIVKLELPSPAPARKRVRK